MCKALEKLEAPGRMEGRLEGRFEGRLEGRSPGSPVVSLNEF